MGEVSRFTLALDIDLKEAMLQKAKQNDRNLNGEISRAIRFYLKHANTTDTFVADPQVSTIGQPVVEVTATEKDTPSPASSTETDKGKEDISVVSAKPKARRI